MLKSLFSSASLQSINLDGTHFTIKHTKRKNMKRMVLRVEQRNEIRLSSSRVSKQRLEAFILEQKAWILHQHANIDEPFAQGSDFYYLGKVHTIEHHSKALEIRNGTIYLNPLRAKKQSDEFYKHTASQHLSSRILLWKEKMGLTFNELRFRCAKRRWGSCNSKGVITLNPYMMKLSYEMIDYIIVHELAHLKHMNHSKDFYALVEQYIPNYASIQKQIRDLTQVIN